MKKILFAPKAKNDVITAGDWYEEQQEGLGTAFVESFDHLLTQIATQPAVYQIVGKKHQKEVRRANFSRFPYALLFYVFDDEAIYVLHVFHQRQRPLSLK